MAPADPPSEQGAGDPASQGASAALLATLVEQARGGSARAVGRLLSLVEDESPLLREAMAALAPHTGRAHVVGVTGAPGVGKSTCTDALVAELRRTGRRIAVLAVDPSSPYSGGALLGDRVRMSRHSTDPGVFIRSTAARGHLGGLAWSTPQALRVLDASGFDVVLVETVGVGQSEMDVARAADTTVLVLGPEMGDGIQTVKAGILEVGDVYAVNKADLDGAVRVRRDLVGLLRVAHRPAGAWAPPVLLTTARDGQGVAEVAAALDEHLGWIRRTGELRRRRLLRARHEVEAIAVTGLRRRWTEAADRLEMDDLAEQVLAGVLDPYAAADRLLDG